MGTHMKPIFIGGCSRSGTTLLGAMLGAHSRIVTTPESHFKTEVYALLNRPSDEIDFALEKIILHHRFRHWSLLLQDKQTIIKHAQGSYSQLILLLAEAYGRKKLKKTSPQFWVDHTPSNVNYAHLLQALFPDLKMIHIVRDGRAVAASIIPLDWGPNTAIGAAHFWLESLAFGIVAEAYIGPQCSFRVAYESLVSDPEGTMQSICRFVDVPFEESMVKGEGFDPPAYTRSQHQLIGKAPEKSVIYKWRKQLSRRQIEEFEAVTADMLVYLGYERQKRGKAIFPSVVRRFTSELAELSRGYLVNKLRHQIRRLKS